MDLKLMYKMKRREAVSKGVSIPSSMAARTEMGFCRSSKVIEAEVYEVGWEKTLGPKAASSQWIFLFPTWFGTKTQAQPARLLK
jgi:hypothetical protein